MFVLFNIKIFMLLLLEMPKYYSLLYINCDSPRECYVSNIIKISSSADIYDYLTNVYLKYKKTNDSGKYKTLCDRLDIMIESMKYDEDDIDVDYENVYKWIKDDCSEDHFDKIVVTKEKLNIA